jgi:opacity protein-like surface antigen
MRFLLLASLLLLCSQAARAQTDWGQSHNLLLTAKISGDWFIISRSNLASRDDFSDYFFGYTGAGLGYRLSPRWSLRAGYRRAWIRPRDDWLDEHRWYAETYFADRLRGFRITNRSRVEFRTFDYRADDVRLRNEITVEAPWTLTSLKLKPYLEEEAFYSTRDGQFEANWLGAGLAWRPADGVKLKLGYRWNHFRVGDAWNDRNVIVTGVNLFF